jgi:hypothetical protein
MYSIWIHRYFVYNQYIYDIYLLLAGGLALGALGIRGLLEWNRWGAGPVLLSHPVIHTDGRTMVHMLDQVFLRDRV